VREQVKHAVGARFARCAKHPTDLSYCKTINALLRLSTYAKLAKFAKLLRRIDDATGPNSCTTQRLE
jgi:hypothetical protein